MSDINTCSDEIRACQLCALAKTRTLAVPGHGSVDAKILFVGEAPGANEDRQGIPFVGAAGQILDGMLKLIQLDRSAVFITNIVKCRPPNNRDPFPDEKEACSSYLDRQINMLNPYVIVPLGRHAASHWFPNEPISKIRAQSRQIGNLTLFPLYHPAAALHNGKLREAIQADFLKLGELLVTLSFNNRPTTRSTPEVTKDPYPSSDKTPSQMRML